VPFARSDIHVKSPIRLLSERILTQFGSCRSNGGRPHVARWTSQTARVYCIFRRLGRLRICDAVAVECESSTMDLCDGSDIALCQDVRCIASTNGAREVKALQPIALSIWSAIEREIKKTRKRERCGRRSSSILYLGADRDGLTLFRKHLSIRAQ
jgi:hypothetical protein